MNYFFILGSAYDKHIEYDLPKRISTEKWKVYSVDLLSNENKDDENKDDENKDDEIDVTRLSMSVTKLIDLELVDETNKSIEGKNIYILDSISCGFVTETAKQLWKKYSPTNNVYFIHYISPYSEYHSIEVTQHPSLVMYIYAMFFKMVPDIKNVVQVSQRVAKEFKGRFLFELADSATMHPRFPKNMRPQIYKKAAEILTSADISLIATNFVKINKLEDFDTAPFEITCPARNDWMVGGKSSGLALSVFIIILLILTLLIFPSACTFLKETYTKLISA
jgi:hypothetical protein